MACSNYECYDNTARGKDWTQCTHRGPIFLPWHREFLRRFEKELQMPMPYWKWEDEADPYKAGIWNWLGGNGDPNEIVRNFDTGKFWVTV